MLKLSLYGVFVVFCAIAFQYVLKKVPEPFIDEIFHLTQCQKYCAYKFNEWDNKITTPPGLYILGLAYTRAIQLVTLDNIHSLFEACTNDILRSVNLVGGLVVLPLSLQVLDTDNFWTVNIMALPLLVSYYFLFYTDVWATILVVIALVLVVQKPLGLITSVYTSAIVAFTSLWFRQTNILWVAFILAILIDKRCKRRANDSFILEVITFISQTFKDWLLVVPFILVILLFAAFVVYNGGITLGDKENHTLNLHVVQVFYCMVFIVGFTWPVWLSTKTIKDYLKFTLGGAIPLSFTLISFYSIKYIIANFTVVHPFLLADNRHYTFYIWRKILNQKYSWVAMVPIYHFCTWTVISSLIRGPSMGKSSLKLSPITIIAFVIVVIATIIPSPLFEPRYYILPLVIFRMFIGPVQCNTFTTRTRHVTEFIWSMLINVLTITVFLSYEFKWPTENSVQRIIW